MGRRSRSRSVKNIPTQPAVSSRALARWGSSPLVSTQFQFVDTGVNVELTPHVHGTDEVTLHVSVDISSVANTINLGGISQPVIAQKKNEADIRLRDGEVSMLGGLMQTQDTETETGIPGLVNIPILGKFLFGANTKDKQKEELMIALIPHILRTPDISAVDLRGISAGTDQTVKLSYGQRPDEEATTGEAAPGTPSAGASAAAGTKAAAPAAPRPAAPPSSTTPVMPAPRAIPAPSTAVNGPPRLLFAPANLSGPLGSAVVVTLQADNMTDLADVRVKITWDPKILRLERPAPGTLLTQDGNVTAPSLDVRNDTGEASVDISRVAGSSGVTGSGPLMQFTFTAVGKGMTTVTVSEANLKTSSQQAVNVTAPKLVVTVQ